MVVSAQAECSSEEQRSRASVPAFETMVARSAVTAIICRAWTLPSMWGDGLTVLSALEALWSFSF